MKVTSKSIREIWLNYYKEKGHAVVEPVSLIGSGDTGVMFNVAGMQPLMPYLLGEKHPLGTRLCNVQGCIRTVDIETVGDTSHLTFFEMMGNWSLGDYFKKEKTAWTFELLTKYFGYEADKIHTTVFEGDENVERDMETYNYLVGLGINKNNIWFLPKSDNWWNLPGTVNTPCGPDNEWFYPLTDVACGENCGPACDCSRYVEIGNDVYMQYEQLENNQYRTLKSQNVDTGFGLERNLMYLNGLTDVYKTDLFADVIALIESKTGLVYGQDESATKSMRIIADHIRTATMLLGDIQGCVPSNIGAGYILRRLIRRAVRHSKSIGLQLCNLIEISKIYIEKVYAGVYTNLADKQEFIEAELNKEFSKFEKTLEQGNKEISKLMDNLTRFAPDNKRISGDKAFRLFDTFGFPLELTCEIAAENGFDVDRDGFAKAFERHQELSKGTNKSFKGGLENDSKKVVYLHTATHLLNAALKNVVDNSCNQKGSNITSERLRFDFNCDHKLSAEEIKSVEDFVNNAINSAIEITMEEMSVEKAKEQNAVGVFGDKYGDSVKVYSIGNVSKEICGGPHASNTRDLVSFKILKEEASSAGVRRIKADIGFKE